MSLSPLKASNKIRRILGFPQAIWRERQLAWLLTVRQVQGRYKGSALGWLWSIITPLLMLTVYTFVFSSVFNARWGDLQRAGPLGFAINLFAGLIVFNLFSETVTEAPQLILANANYVTKVIFPLEILPVVNVASAVFHAVTSLGVLAIFELVAIKHIPLTLIWLPLVWLPLVWGCLALSWILAALGVYLRDIGQVIGVVTSMLMFLSAVFYPLTALPQQWQPILALNPLVAVIEQTRRVTVSGTPRQPVASRARIPPVSTSPPGLCRCTLSEMEAEFNSQLALQVSAVSKCYQIYEHPRDRLLQGIWGARRQLFREFWALQELTLQLKRGQTLGVVGRNGSGKSTLLQLICGTLTPTTGKVQVLGRIGALLELGTGFNPEFSGRENVLLNASLLGLKRSEIEDCLDDILAFADIGDFIDQPVKTYSSGMAVRLAFAVQAHIKPDLLVVDEALAVGDELFQKKCYAHLERLKETGTSILLVTHSCPQIIQHCDQALLLHKGQARLLGAPAQVTTIYQRLINAEDSEWNRVLPPAGVGGIPPSPETRSERIHATGSASSTPDNTAWLDEQLVPSSTVRYPERGAKIISVQTETTAASRANVLPAGEPFHVVLQWQAIADLERVSCSCHIASLTGQRITGQRYPELNTVIESVQAESTWTVRFEFTGGLWPGIYFIGAGIMSTAQGERAFLHRIVDACALRILDDEKLAVIGSCNLAARLPTITPSLKP